MKNRPHAHLTRHDSDMGTTQPTVGLRSTVFDCCGSIDLMAN